MPDDAPFAGRILQILATERLRGGTIEDPRIERLADRQYIVGKLVDVGQATSDSRVGRLFWFALDEVIGICEFADAEEARAAFALNQKLKASKSSPRVSRTILDQLLGKK
jgi:hypothetical protein